MRGKKKIISPFCNYSSTTPLQHVTKILQHPSITLRKFKNFFAPHLAPLPFSHSSSSLSLSDSRMSNTLWQFLLLFCLQKPLRCNISLSSSSSSSSLFWDSSGCFPAESFFVSLFLLLLLLQKCLSGWPGFFFLFSPPFFFSSTPLYIIPFAQLAKKFLSRHCYSQSLPTFSGSVFQRDTRHRRVYTETHGTDVPTLSLKHTVLTCQPFCWNTRYWRANPFTETHGTGVPTLSLKHTVLACQSFNWNTRYWHTGPSTEAHGTDVSTLPLKHTVLTYRPFHWNTRYWRINTSTGTRVVQLLLLKHLVVPADV